MLVLWRFKRRSCEFSRWGNGYFALSLLALMGVQVGCALGVVNEGGSLTRVPECQRAADCNDGNPCTDDRCIAGLCEYINNPASCEGCQASAECDDGNPCTDDQCTSGSCTHTNNSASCSDNNSCTEGDYCSAGACRPGEAVDSEVCNEMNGERGYVARACGFDLDGDGIIGEEDDDCNVCDGETTDPDGDGRDEDLIYVDCSGGSDSGSCGSPGNPCATIGHALNERADGPGDGAEDIICFTGRCTTENAVRVSTSGITAGGEGSTADSAYYVRPKQGNQVRDFQYPQNPLMIVGWDYDDDGEYPPFDGDDESVIDGGPNRIKRLFQHGSSSGDDLSSIEYAHFVVRDYGRGDFGSGDASSISDNNEIWKIGDNLHSNHLYFHDLQFDRVMHNQETDGHNIIFDVFKTRASKWWAFENINAVEVGGFMMRGNAPMPGLGNVPANSTGSGPLRFQGNSWSYHVADASDVKDDRQASVAGIKIWGDWRDVEILDNISDGNISDWTPSNPFNASVFTNIGCSVLNFHIINNETIDLNMGYAIQPDNDGQDNNCGTIDNGAKRRQDNIFFLRNIARLTERGANFYTRAWGIFLESSKNGTWDEAAENVTVANNMIYSPGNNYQACIEVAIGTGDKAGCRPYTGQISIVGNTCYGGVGGFAKRGAYSFFARVDYSPKCKHDNVVLKNNIAAGLRDGQYNVWVGGIKDDAGRAAWDGLTNDYNVFDPDADFAWTSGNGIGAHSNQCAPKFARDDNRTTPLNGNLHLYHSDTCARNQGTDIADITQEDIDCGSRPAGGAWDVGADEVGVEGLCFGPNATTSDGGS